VPRECLQQTLRDLERACRRHGALGVRYRSKRRWRPSIRFSSGTLTLAPQRLSRRHGALYIPKPGRVRLRWTRSFEGNIRNVTLARDAHHWYVSYCVEDTRTEMKPRGIPAVGVDRGVVIAIATSDGQMFRLTAARRQEQRRMKRLQRRLARQQPGSCRRLATISKFQRVSQRARNRRADFAHQTAHRLTSDYGLVAVEDLRVRSMTRSARGASQAPGVRVRQKAGSSVRYSTRGEHATAGAAVAREKERLCDCEGARAVLLAKVLVVRSHQSGIS
jgi:transposase